MPHIFHEDQMRSCIKIKNIPNTYEMFNDISYDYCHIIIQSLFSGNQNQD